MNVLNGSDLLKKSLLKYILFLLFIPLLASSVSALDCDSGSKSTTCYVNTAQVIGNGTNINSSESFNVLVIQDGGLLTHLENASDSINISAVNLTIESGGEIDVRGKGYRGGINYNDGWGGVTSCQGAYARNNNEDGGGGGHGGYGSNSVGGRGEAYGNATHPLTQGCGGGSGRYYSAQIGFRYPDGGAGGGLIILEVTDTLTVNGEITANGGAGGTFFGGGGVNIHGGGGAGGGIFIRTSDWFGTGNITAHGSYKAGGGRIAVYYNSKSFTGLITAGDYDPTTRNGTVYQQNGFGNRIWGTAADVIKTGLTNALSVKIDNNEVASNTLFGFAKTINFFDGGNKIMDVSHDFWIGDFNLSKVHTTKTSNSVIVNISDSGYVGSKILYLTGGYSSVCVDDSPISSADDISDSCSETSETLFNQSECTSGTTKGGITCSLSGSVWSFSGLNYSGVEGQGGGIDKSLSVSGANVTKGISGRLTKPSASSDAAQARNTTELNLSSAASTVKWQGYFGEVTATLSLGIGSDQLFSFGSATNDQIKSVLASPDSGFDFSSLQTASVSDVDSAWGFAATDVDSATLTLNGNSTIAQVSSVSTVNLNAYSSSGIANSSIYKSGVLADKSSPTTILDFVFGVSADSDERDFRNVSVVDYELIVPVNTSGVAGTQTYYFFLDVE